MKLGVILIALAAAPSFAQSSGCVRDAAGALICSSRPVANMPNAARRLPSTRDLSAAAVARGRAQAQAMRDSSDEERRVSNDREAMRRQIACPGSPPPSAGSLPGSRSC